MSVQAQAPAPLGPFDRLKRLFGTRRQPQSASIPVRRIAHNLVGKGFADPRQRKGVRRIVVTIEDPTFNLIRERSHATSACRRHCAPSDRQRPFRVG